MAWNRRKKWLIVIVVLALVILFWQYEKKEAAIKQTQVEKAAALLAAPKEKKKDSAAGQDKTEGAAKHIVVDIKGEVKHPGVYTLAAGLRVNDAIQYAGGLTGKADESQINLAQKLADEMVIHVPARGEEPAGDSVPGAAAGQSPDAGGGTESKVNINTGDAEALQKLPGIGPAKAAAIINYRKQHGLFKKVDDLTNVTGIGEKSLERIKPLAVVN